VYWSTCRVSATPIVTTAPFVSVPVTAKRVTVERGCANTRSPGPAVTLVSACGPDTLNRIAPSAPALGVVSETVTTPATGPMLLQLPAPPHSANVTNSHPLTRFITTDLSAQPHLRSSLAAAWQR